MRFATVLTLLTVVAAPAWASGDAKEGEKVFAKCRSCHSVEAGKNGVGPSLNGVLGRKSGTLEKYAYSKAMTEKGVVWDEKTIAAYIADPKAYVPGNKMIFPGLKKESEVENLLAYLKSLPK